MNEYVKANLKRDSVENLKSTGNILKNVLVLGVLAFGAKFIAENTIKTFKDTSDEIMCTGRRIRNSYDEWRNDEDIDDDDAEV